MGIKRMTQAAFNKMTGKKESPRKGKTKAGMAQPRRFIKVSEGVQKLKARARHGLQDNGAIEAERKLALMGYVVIPGSSPKKWEKHKI